MVGPPLEAEEWRRRVKAAVRLRCWKLVTGAGSTGYPWAARTGLDDERARATTDPDPKAIGENHAAPTTNATPIAVATAGQVMSSSDSRIMGASYLRRA